MLKKSSLYLNSINIIHTEMNAVQSTFVNITSPRKVS